MSADNGSPRFDLQSHSNRSDGALPPAEVVQRAQSAGVELLALSDHDTISGVQEALEAGRSAGIDVVTAVEISTVDGTEEDLHILGYGIDHRDRALLGALHGFRDEREARADHMSQALEELGLRVDTEVLEARARSGGSIGRPHLARAVFDHPANKARLAEEQLDDASQLLQAYLLPGKPAYRARSGPSVPDAIAAIHAAGGLAVWAHPFWNIPEPDRVLSTIERFVDFGVDGVEVFYVTHDREQTLLLADTCERLGLLSTGSADFHGPEHPLFSRFRAFDLHGREPRLGAIVPGG